MKNLEHFANNPIANSNDFIDIATQYVKKSKLGSVSLYNESGYTESERLQILAYSKVLGYSENYVRDLLKENNGKVDMKGESIASLQTIAEKIINIEQFTTNACNNIFDLGLEKMTNKTQVNKYVYDEKTNSRSVNMDVDYGLISNQALLDTYGPAFALEIKEKENDLKNKELQARAIYKQFKNKNKSKAQAKKQVFDLLSA